MIDKIKKYYALFILLGICLLLIGFIFITYSIDKNQYKSFSVEINNNLYQFDFDKFYNDIYQASKSKNEIKIQE